MIAFRTARHRHQKLLAGVVPGGRTAAADLDAAITNIFNHPNVGPFIGRQLIQQLVTASPAQPMWRAWPRPSTPARAAT